MSSNNIVYYTRGCSSLGRASGLHSEGSEFDSRQLHNLGLSETDLLTIDILFDNLVKDIFMEMVLWPNYLL